jgi:hypothetical protein
MNYCGIFPDGNYIQKPRLEDIIVVPGIEYYLKIESGPANYLDCIFALITKSGTPHFLRINNIELRDIGVEEYDKLVNKRKAKVTLYDHNKELTVQEFIVTDGKPSFLKDELIPLMKSLNSGPSQNETTDLEKLKAENDSLKQKLDLLTNQLSSSVFKLN